MRIAISATNATLDAEVDPRFGRCQYFIIVDPETTQFEAMENSSAMASRGAGISAAQMVADKGVQAILTGNCGPNAYQVLSSAGIQVISGVSGNVKDVIEGYRAGKFKASNRANVPDHFGMEATPGTEGSFGMGRGMGRGRGMGMGPGMTQPASPVPPPQSPEQEIRALKAQSQAVAQQLTDIQLRIDDLEKKKS